MAFQTIKDERGSKMVESHTGWELKVVSSTDLTGKDMLMRLEHAEGQIINLRAVRHLPASEGYDVEWRADADLGFAAIDAAAAIELITRAMSDFGISWGHVWEKPLKVKVSVVID